MFIFVTEEMGAWGGRESMGRQGAWGAGSVGRQGERGEQGEMGRDGKSLMIEIFLLIFSKLRIILNLVPHAPCSGLLCLSLQDL